MFERIMFFINRVLQITRKFIFSIKQEFGAFINNIHPNEYNQIAYLEKEEQKTILELQAAKDWKHDKFIADIVDEELLKIKAKIAYAKNCKYLFLK